MKKVIVGAIALALNMSGAQAAPKNAVVKDLTVTRDAVFKGGIQIKGATVNQVLISDAEGNFIPQTLEDDGTVNPFTATQEGIYTDKNVAIGATPISDADLFVKGNTLVENLRITNLQTATSASDTCQVGTVFFDANYIYACIAPNTFKRAALATW